MSEEQIAAQNNNEVAKEAVVTDTIEKVATETAEVKEGQVEETKKEAESNVVDDYVLKPMEGVTFNEDLTKVITDVAKAEGIPQASLQKVVDQYAAKVQEMQTQQFAAWEKESETAFGDKKDEILTVAGMGLKKFDPTGALAKDLDNTGLGNKKEWIEFFAAIGRSTKEATPVEGNPAKGGTFLDSMYPNMK